MSRLATFLLTGKATHASGWNPTQFSHSNNFYWQGVWQKRATWVQRIVIRARREGSLACGSPFLTSGLGIGGLTHISHEQKHPPL